MSHQTTLDQFRQERPKQHKKSASKKCIYCNSSKLIHNGTRTTKIGKRPRILCQSCGRTFVSDRGNFKATYSKTVIMAALRERNKGKSLRECADMVNRRVGVTSCNHATILYWKEKYKAVKP